MVGALFYTAEAKKKDKKKKKDKTEVAAPIELLTTSDTLSYAGGMTMTDGLLPYLINQLKVDTAYMEDFVRGFKEITENGEDPKTKAYSAGMNIGSRMLQMLEGMKKEVAGGNDTIVEKIALRGFTDALTSDTSHYDVKRASALFKTKFEAAKKAKDEKLYGENKKKGQDFLVANKSKEGVVTTASGLQYKVLVKGEGETPKKTDKVLVNYEGKLIDGTVFDASSKHGSKPASFRADQVIKGWTEALCMMPVGSKWELYIPYELAYGERNMGKDIKPYSALIFTVELVGIDSPKAKTEAKKADDTKADTTVTAKATTAKKTATANKVKAKTTKK